jgi:hypothetical protein
MGHLFADFGDLTAAILSFLMSIECFVSLTSVGFRMPMMVSIVNELLRARVGD